MIQKFIKNQDLYTTIFIGIVTIFTAYVTFVGSVWGSTASALYSKSIIELNDANTAYLEHIQGGLTEAEEEEVAKEFQEGWDQSEEKILKADAANSNNDKYLLMTVILSISIFFASLSLTLKKEEIKMYFFVFAIILFLISLIWTSTLPIPSF